MKLQLRYVAFLFLAFIANNSFAQAPNISYTSPQVYTAGTAISPLTPANNGGAVPLPTPVTIASGLNNVTGVAVDALGNVYVAENGNSDVKEIPVGGGSPIVLASGLVATGVAVDAAGNVYIVDNGENVIRKLPVGGGDAILIGSGFNGPYGIAVDAAGNLYVGDANNNAVKKIPAGSNTPVSIGTGFNHPTGVAVDAAGNVYVADRADNAIKKILANGGSTITLANGSGNPNGVAVDAAGNVYFADTYNNSITELLVNGSTATVGSGFSIPTGLAISGADVLYVANTGAGEVQKMNVGGYTINQALSAGLSFNNNTGVISGTPTAASPSTKYTIIATNSSGSSTATLNITVNLPAKPIISYSTPQVYTMTVPISNLFPVNTGGAIPATGGYSINPALPAGLGFDPNGGTISGIPTVASPATNYTVTATNLGGSGTAIINITVKLPPKPIISYASPQAFTTFTAISPITPVNTGGAVAPPSVVSLVSGLNNPNGVAFDAAGNIYVAENGNNDVKKIPAGGGTPIIIGSGFKNPTGVAVDASGNVYVADCNNNQVKEIPVGGGAIIILGSGFNAPYGIALDAANNIYVSDFNNNAVKKIPAGNGSVLTLATGFNGPTGVAVDASGNIYVADQHNNAIKKIAAGGSTVVTLTSGFGNPDGVAVDPAGNVYFSDLNHSSITELPVSGGNSITVGSGFTDPASVAVNGSGVVYLSDNGAVKQINPGGYSVIPSLPAGLSLDINAGTISGTPTVVSAATNYTITASNAGGNGTAVINISVKPYPVPSLSYHTPDAYPVNVAMSPLVPTSSGVGPGGSNTTVTLASGLNNLTGVAVDNHGNVYVAENGNNDVKKIPIDGGSPIILGSGFIQPTGVAVDAIGNVFVVDNGHNTLWKIPVGGGAMVAVGSGFSGPYGVALDGAGNIYIGDASNNEVKKIPAGSNTPVIIGSGFNHPTGVAVDAAGNVYVADRANNAIKEILVNGGSTITLGSGNGNPNGVAVDAAGNVYYADTNSNSIIEIPAGGGAKIPVGSGGLFNPTAVAVVGSNIIYVADNGAATVVKITITGGYTINPALPAGLSFDSNTGIISGTPTAVSPATSYTITAYNVGGSTSVTVNISVFSQGAALANLAISSGTLAPVFAATTTTYTASVPFAVASIAVTPTTADPAATVTVNGIAVASGAVSGPVTLNQGSNTITTVVTAQDGITTKTYTIKITRAAPSTNALLASISLSPVSTLVGSTGPGYLNFTSAVGGSESSVQVIPTAKDATSTITVNGVVVTSGTPSQPIALNEGANTITTVITAQDGVTTKTIIITVNKAASNNAGLANIALSSGTLAPAFATTTNSYTASVGSATASITLTPTASDATATIKVNGTAVTNGSASASIPLVTGPNTITTIVTAQDGKTIKAYTVVVTRLSSNAALANLTISSATLLPAFATATTVYTASVPYATASVTITPTTSDPTATVIVNGTTVTSGSASGVITLNQGSNTITTVVTAQDGTTTKTYTVKVTRAAPSTNALLASISLSPVSTLVGATGPGYLNFTSSVGGNESSVQVIATTKDATATITVNGIAATSGVASQPIDLVPGANTITTVITAQDGVTTKTIIITVNKAPSTNAGLANITLSSGTLTPVFATATASYTASVGNAATSITVTPATNDGSATVQINGCR